MRWIEKYSKYLSIRVTLLVNNMNFMNIIMSLIFL